MCFWEMMCGGADDYAMLVHANPDAPLIDVFVTDGKAKQWKERPSIQPCVDKRRKRQKPQSDIGHIAPGTLILNEKANLVLRDLFLKFGELLEVSCNDEVKYCLNVTNLMSCIDVENSTKMGNAVTKPVFLDDAIPTGVQIFKDPLTVRTRIYLTTEAKTILEHLITDAKLTGLAIFKAGEVQY